MYLPHIIPWLLFRGKKQMHKRHFSVSPFYCLIIFCSHNYIFPSFEKKITGIRLYYNKLFSFIGNPTKLEKLYKRLRNEECFAHCLLLLTFCPDLPCSLFIECTFIWCFVTKSLSTLVVMQILDRGDLLALEQMLLFLEYR